VDIAVRYPDIVNASLDAFARDGFHGASIRQIARAANLSTAGLYHYVKGKDELLFLAIDSSLDRLLEKLDGALRGVPEPEARLLALIQTHLDFAFHSGAALKIINRDIELLPAASRTLANAKRYAYIERGAEILRSVDRSGRSEDELLQATNLLLAMLNGIATRPFMAGSRSPDNPIPRLPDPSPLAQTVLKLFLHGFLAAPFDAAATAEETAHAR